MNYQKIYDNLISKGRNRTFETGIYYETHHIIPRCLDGLDVPENLVRLTPEEHYLAHQLLVKLNPLNQKIAYAATAMSACPRGNRSTNKIYGWLRKNLSESLKGQKRGPHSDETKLKMSLSAKGRKKSEEHRKKLGLAQLGKKRQPHSEETKEKMRAKALGRKMSDEARKKMSDSRKGVPLSEAHRKSLSEVRKGKKINRKKNVFI